MKKKQNNNSSPIAYIPDLIRLVKPDGTPFTEQEYIRLYQYLPDLVLKKHGFIPQEITAKNLENYGFLIDEYREIFQALGKWFIYKLYLYPSPNKTNTVLPADLILTWKTEYEPLAQRAKKLLYLCESILERDPLNWQDELEGGLTAREFWFNSELESLEHAFLHNGILNDFEHLGKDKAYKQAQKNLKQHKNSINSIMLNYRGISMAEAENKPQTNSVNDSLIAYAKLIAERDRDFCWQILYPFWKTESKLNRYLRDNTNFQNIGLKNSLENFEIWIGGNGKRGVSQKNKP